VWARFGSSPPLALVGAGPVDPRHPDLSAFARRTGVQAFVFGRVPEPQLAWLYRHATLLLFPSRYEGFGSPLAEALDHGVPAIVSDIPAFREIGEGAAHFVAPDRVAVWGEAVAALAADSGERERMRDAGRRIAARLTYEQTARDVLGSLRDAVAGGTSA
jgi:glycosyltransferase involved in cell wall biosynthesis